ncbi:MAG: ThiF family adenylyltransferase [Candidatus Dormibacteria bacterium]
MAVGVVDFRGRVISVAMTSQMASELTAHLDKGSLQEDLTFAYWRPSRGARRVTAVLSELNLPQDGDRILHGNVEFTGQYVRRVLAEAPAGCGVALLHSHLGPGWQGMSDDDEVAERDRLASAAAGRTGQPLLGLTRGTDGSWSGRFWLRKRPFTYVRRWAHTVRVVGKCVKITYLPSSAVAGPTPLQQATISVWGHEAQANLVRARIGIVGLGSVGSICAEALSRVGFQQVTLIDHDLIEDRNLDRTLATTRRDLGRPKVRVAARNMRRSHTAGDFSARVMETSLLTPEGLAEALDCDVLLCCVDRPWPRFLLNAIAYSQLIPVVDGGILARVKSDGTPLHITWRIHTVTPGCGCLVCIGALRMSDVALDMAGKLDDPDYLRGLSDEERAMVSRRNVFPFSLSVGAHQVLQLITLLTGMPRIGGTGPQTYHAYPGTMLVSQLDCEPDCPFASLTASATDLSVDLPPHA